MGEVLIKYKIRNMVVICFLFREDKKLIPQMNGTKNLHFGIKLFPPLRKFHALITYMYNM